MALIRPRCSTSYPGSKADWEIVTELAAAIHAAQG